MKFFHGSFLRKFERGAYLIDWVKPKRVLDIGCSDGRILGYLQARGFEVSGIEVDADKAKSAKERGVEDVLVVDVEEYDLTRLGGYDTIILNAVIEHLNSPYLMLEKLKDVLNPDGIVLLNTPNVNCVLWHIYNLIGGTPWAWVDHEHKYFFDYLGFKCMLEKVGYRILDARFVGKIPKMELYYTSPFPALSFEMVFKLSLK